MTLSPLLELTSAVLSSITLALALGHEDPTPAVVFFCLSALALLLSYPVGAIERRDSWEKGGVRK